MARRTVPSSTAAGFAGLTVLTTVLTSGLAPAGAVVAPAARASAAHGTSERSSGDGDAEARGSYDARVGSGMAAQAATRRAAARALLRPATRELRRSLGSNALLDIDGTTGTPRLVGRLNGYLTGPSHRSGSKIVLGWVSANRAALGLTTRDLRTLRLKRAYRDVSGTVHWSWTQRVGGVPVFGNGLTASVTRSGRLLSVGGSPVSGADVVVRRSPRIATGAAAIRAARRDLGERSTTPGRRDTASQVLFVTRGGSHLGWQTVTMSAQHPALSVLDERTGAVLFRRPLSSDASGKDRDSRGSAYRYFPGAPKGGTQQVFDYTKLGWLAAGATTLSGNNSHAYSDVDDDNLPGAAEEAPPRTAYSWDYRLVPFLVPNVSFCSNPYPCSWDPNTPYSWRTNRAQNTNQVFYFVNRWHDHLAKAPIGFTEAAGNFQLRNSGTKGRAGDAVDTQTEDGADTNAGLPDGSHIDNANMDTPPDGQAPRMQMYLQHQPGKTYPAGDPFAPTDVGDEADTVYHEYTHGLSNRLVIDASGNSTLGPVQAGAMGEAWSDWYAMDDLVHEGLQKDEKGTADIVLFQYDGAGTALDRTEPIDCKVHGSARACSGGATGHTGGYTYADVGHVIGLPEVHADGEIWSQTLWDLRDALGSKLSDSLVTRAMELSPSNPSFLDERNAILMADTAVSGGKHHAAIWKVFAHRGMGFYAGSLGGDDSAPGADFHRPPSSVRRAYITGTVTEASSGQPISGAPVTLAFQGGGVVNPSATTAADGTYVLGPVPVGTYRKLVTGGAGYEQTTKSVRVRPGGGHQNLTTRRDWAASAGGASISNFTGPDFSPACGPGGAIDGNLASGWGSTTGNDAGDPTGTPVPKTLTVKLPTAVDVSDISIDPSATCGDGASASLAGYTLETSPDGTVWTTVATGTFTSDDDGRLNPVTPTTGAGGVGYVRLTMRTNQTPDFAANCPAGSYSGCSFTDMTELAVHGKASD